MLKNKSKYVYIAGLIFSAFFVTWLTFRYFPVEPDSANSPIVWRAFITSGFYALDQWSPTIDNWYFTVYPVNFIVFYLLGNDGPSSLKIATALFSIFIIFSASYLIKDLKGRVAAFISIIALTAIPAFNFTYGFIAHPFSHNSTNAFGFLCLIIAFFNIKYKSVTVALISSLVALMASISDPWFMASFFIPIVFSAWVMSYFEKKFIIHAIIYSIMCAIGLSNIVQISLGLPIHKLLLVTPAEMLENLKWTILILGRSLNLFFIDNTVSYVASFIIWLTLIVLYFSMYIKSKQKCLKSIFFNAFTALSIAGIVSSFIITYQGPDYISARFFVNIVFIAIIICVLGCFSNIKLPFFVIIWALLANSAFSYIKVTLPLHEQSPLVLRYIDFLKRNNLTYGYGSFWDKANTVTWLSGGYIHITPVFFNPSAGTIDFSSARQQTMKFWHSSNFIKAAPQRQFIAVTLAADGERCTEWQTCIDGIEKQVGTPDEVLVFEDTKILVYNEPIKTGI